MIMLLMKAKQPFIMLSAAHGSDEYVEVKI
jgi:hypothetical protein